MENNFYVYIYFDPRKPGNYIYDDLKFDYEPFYVGKGKNDRIKSSLRIRNHSKFKEDKLRYFKQEKIEIISHKIYENIDEEKAFKLEIEIINKIGRLDLKKGPLTNVTNGGEGGAGRIISLDEIEKIKDTMSIRYKIKTPNEEFLEFRGTNQVKDYFEKLNQKLELTSRFKISSDGILYGKGSKNYKLISKSNDYRNMKITDDKRKKISENNTKMKNMNSVAYKIRLPNMNIKKFIGRNELKSFIDTINETNNSKISFYSIVDKGSSKGYVMVEKIKINKKRID